jgi:fructose-bisphosphate aldolase class I
MDTNILISITKQLLTKGKGILAADESNKTANERFSKYDISETEEMRRSYRELLFSTPNIEKYISGVIMYDETFWQKEDGGKTFPEYLESKGILPGIKVDIGAVDSSVYPGEKITHGLDDLEERIKKYKEANAQFTKWRAVIAIDKDLGLPTQMNIDDNTENMAIYAKIIQGLNMVPIVEPEVLLKGKHNIKESYDVHNKVLSSLFIALKKHDVYLPGLILKTSMVISGDKSGEENSPKEVAKETLNVLKENVPSEIGGVVFLSGGQTPVEALSHLDAMAEQEPLPWEIAFSYSRALQEPAMREWRGKKSNWAKAQEILEHRLKLASLADSGAYDIELEYDPEYF